jgi:hypothetical protein
MMPHHLATQRPNFDQLDLEFALFQIQNYHHFLSVHIDPYLLKSDLLCSGVRDAVLTCSFL